MEVSERIVADLVECKHTVEAVRTFVHEHSAEREKVDILKPLLHMLYKDEPKEE